MSHICQPDSSGVCLEVKEGGKVGEEEEWSGWLRRNFFRDEGEHEEERGKGGVGKEEGKEGVDQERAWRRLALFMVLLSVALPVVWMRNMDDMSGMLSWKGQRRSEEEGEEGGGAEGRDKDRDAIPMSKWLFYRIDVLFSTHSWFKSAALLSATAVL